MCTSVFRIWEFNVWRRKTWKNQFLCESQRRSTPLMVSRTYLIVWNKSSLCKIVAGWLFFFFVCFFVLPLLLWWSYISSFSEKHSSPSVPLVVFSHWHHMMNLFGKLLFFSSPHSSNESWLCLFWPDSLGRAIMQI